MTRLTIIKKDGFKYRIYQDNTTVTWYKDEELLTVEDYKRKEYAEQIFFLVTQLMTSE